MKIEIELSNAQAKHLEDGGELNVRKVHVTKTWATKEAAEATASEFPDTHTLKPPKLKCFYHEATDAILWWVEVWGEWGPRPINTGERIIQVEMA